MATSRRAPLLNTASRRAPLPSVLRTQRVKARRNLRDMGFLFVSIATSLVFIAVAFLYVWSRLTAVNTGYEISRAAHERDSLMERHRRLSIEYMKQKSPDRIELLAASLGLVHPEPEQVIRVK